MCLGIRNSRIEYTRLKYKYKLFANKLLVRDETRGHIVHWGTIRTTPPHHLVDDVLVLYMPNLDIGRPKQLIAIREFFSRSESNDGHMMRTIKLDDIWEATTIG